MAPLEWEVIAVEPLRIGIVGAGRIAEADVEAYHRLPRTAAVHAVVSSNRERAESRARSWGAKFAYSSVDELFVQNTVDAVDVCLPHHLHRIAVQKARECRTHILLEKPIACSLAEADGILDDVMRAGVVCMVAHNHVFNPIAQEAKAIIDEGLIGDVYLFSAISSAWFFFSEGDFRKSREQTGGGAFIDTGTHFVYVLQYLFRSVRSVAAQMGRRVRAEMGGEDNAVVTLGLDSGVLGSVTVTNAAKEPGVERGFPAGWAQSIEAFGTEGTIRTWLTEDWLLLFSGKRMPPPTATPLSGWVEIGIADAYASSYHAMIAHFVESVVTETPPRLGGEEGRSTLEVIDAVHRSVTGGHTIQLAQTRHGKGADQYRSSMHACGVWRCLIRSRQFEDGRVGSYFAGDALELGRGGHS